MSSTKPRFVAIIPARSGSKGIRDKNITLLDGHPLLVHSVRYALGLKDRGLIEGVWVSTDSEEYAGIARAAGASVLGLRSAHASSDNARDAEFMLEWLEGVHERYGRASVPDWIIQLRPTCPQRPEGLVERCLAACERNPDARVVRTVREIEKSPCKMYFSVPGEGMDSHDDFRIMPCVAEEASGVQQHWEAPRQELPATQLHDGCIDCVNVRKLLAKEGGDMVAILNTDTTADIDNVADVMCLQSRRLADEILTWRGKTIYIDIDDTIARMPCGETDYGRAEPIPECIRVVNRLARDNRVQLWTARGTVTGINWRTVTQLQIRAWGVDPSVELVMGKPAFDVFLDDKTVHSSALRQMASKI